MPYRKVSEIGNTETVYELKGIKLFSFFYKAAEFLTVIDGYQNTKPDTQMCS